MRRLSARGEGAISICLVTLSLLILSHPILAQAASPGQPNPAQSSKASSVADVRVDITSSTQVSGIAGQFVTVRANLTNLSPNETISGVAYISVVDIKNSLPIDLEDWSAQKGIYIPSIAPSQTVASEWSLRLVTAGSYTVDVLYNRNGDLSSPAVSPRISLEVAPRVNLNPGNVLPVAFGVPALLVAVFAIINYRRGKKTGVYG
jgi:hypothetical protein